MAAIGGSRLTNFGREPDPGRAEVTMSETRSGPEATATAAATAAAIDREKIAAVQRVVAPYVRVTPVVEIAGEDFGLKPHRLTLKLEQLQVAGSFKTRGAFANLLLREVPAAGVVAASGGNHGAAVACAAMRLGAPAKIFVPAVCSPAKIARIRGYGAELTVVGERYAEALAAAEAWAERTGALAVHAFDQLETLLGQATLGMELAGQAPGLDTILIAVGGGGLIGGVAAWYAGSARVVGVEPEAAPTLTAALAAGRPVDAPAGGIAADSLAPRRVGELMFPLAQAWIERVVLIGDEDIRRAQQALWEGARIVAEPGGAAAFAALLGGAYQPAPAERVGIVVSGGNTSAVDFAVASRS
jgi:threonine dehydratase